MSCAAQSFIQTNFDGFGALAQCFCKCHGLAPCYEAMRV